jgi:hypothetical protein
MAIEARIAGWPIARPRWLCHAPVELAVGTTGYLWRAAEVEIRVSRISDRPAAVIPLKCVDRLGFLGFLGHVHPTA